MKKDTTEEETVLDSEIDEFDIDEMTEKTFHLRFYDNYSFKIVLED